MMRKFSGKSWLVLTILLAAVDYGRVLNAQSTQKWVGTWASGISGETIASGNQTIAATTFRNNIHLSMGGGQLRVKLTNEFGPVPLTVGQVGIAAHSGTGPSIAGSAHPVTFGGQASVTLPPGAIAISDPISFGINALANVSVDIYLPQQNLPVWSYHQTAISSNYAAAGNQVGAPTLSGSTLTTSWYFLKAVDVETYSSYATVTLGDSTTDGYHSTQDANHRWPDILASRLAGSGQTVNTAVLNAGISGNHVISGINASALARLSRDVFIQSGAKYLIVFEGVNDILTPSPATQTSTDIIAGLAQIVTCAHELGLKVYGGTITPSSTLTTAQQQERTTVNQWIRSSGEYDAVIDFDAVVRNPQSVNALLPAYDSGDHLHPNDAGYEAMGNSIDVSLFE